MKRGDTDALAKSEIAQAKRPPWEGVLWAQRSSKEKGKAGAHR